MPAIYDTYRDYQDAVIRIADGLIEWCGGDFREAAERATECLEDKENAWLSPLLSDVVCEVYAQEQSDWEQRTCVDSVSGPAHDIDEIRRSLRRHTSA